MNTHGHRVIIKDTKARDRWIVVAVVLVIVALLALGARDLFEKKSPNNLRGRVVEKVFTPRHEQLLTYGKGGLKREESLGEYVLRVRVDAEDRTYDVPVDQGTYQLKKVGDGLDFIRPPSEQK